MLTAILIAIILVLSIMVTYSLRYTVVVAQDDFTGFIAKKDFLFYKTAINFANKKADYFDFVFITRLEERIKTVKEKK